ncbi:MAG: sulfatase [Pirellulales bacterium]|nr:sulfatase [Pirellulales bacterium]
MIQTVVRIAALISFFLSLPILLPPSAQAEIAQPLTGQNPSGKRLNILLITADDMNYDSLGVTGCQLPGISPHLDQLAAEGLLFENCHVMTPVCGPSRAAMMTGRYPHCTGFLCHPKNSIPKTWDAKSHKKLPTVFAYLRKAGYLTGVMAKLDSSAAGQLDQFDVKISGADLAAGRDPRKFYQLSKEFFQRALAEGKPFFLNANPLDPHEYWAGQKYETKEWIDMMMGRTDYKTYPNGKPYPDPSRTYQPEQIPIPACYPDTPEIREELVTYYNSMPRLDACVGAVLKALEDTGLEDNTLVVFLSDHGIGKAFAKWSLYPYGTKTPLIVRWPNTIAAGRVDTEHVLSSIDLVPTFIEAAGLPALAGVDGRSLMPILAGENPEDWRQRVYTCFNYMNNYPERDKQFSQFTKDLVDKHDNYRPMRAVTSNHYTYIWNAWADGKREIPLEMSGSQAIRRILGETGYTRRANFEKYRAPEEFYDTAADPGCLKNLITAPDQQQRIGAFRQTLADVMTKSNDHEQKNYQRKVLQQGL